MSNISTNKMALPLYNIDKLPTVSTTDTGDSLENTLIAKVHALRLESFQTSPDSFGSSYEEELLFPHERTRARLSNRHHTYYIATPQHEVSPLNELEWAGILIAHGPQIESSVEGVELAINPWNKSSAKEQETDGQMFEGEPVVVQSVHYQYNGLFVRTSARAHGIGQALMSTAMNDAQKSADAIGALEIKHTVVANSDNTSAMRLYERVGFVVTSKHMYEPRPRGGVDQEERELSVMECSMPLRA